MTGRYDCQKCDQEAFLPGDLVDHLRTTHGTGAQTAFEIVSDQMHPSKTEEVED